MVRRGNFTGATLVRAMRCSSAARTVCNRVWRWVFTGLDPAVKYEVTFAESL